MNHKLINKIPKLEMKNKSEPFIQMSNTCETYNNPIDIALHLIISNYSRSEDENTEIVSEPITVNLIAEVLYRNTTKKNSDVLKEIKGSLKRLVEQQVIDIKPFIAGEDTDNTSTLLVITQRLDKEGKKRFTMINKQVYYQLISHSKFSERINLIAMYCAIAKGIYSKGVNFRPVKSIGQSAGLSSKNTSTKYLNMLIDSKLIRVAKIKFNNPKETNWKYQISKYDDRAMLYQYLIKQITSTDSESTQAIVDLDFLNPSDGNSSNITPKTSKQSDEQTPTIVNEAPYVTDMSDKEVLDDDLASRNEVDDKDVNNESYSGSFFDMFEEDEKEVEQIPKEEVKKPYLTSTDPNILFSDDDDDDDKVEKKSTIIVKMAGERTIAEIEAELDALILNK